MSLCLFPKKQKRTKAQNSVINIDFIDTIFDDNIDLSIKSVSNIKTIYLKIILLNQLKLLIF